MADTGRPTDLTPPVREKILQALSLGNSRKQAAAFAGIGESTFRRWLQRGREEPEGVFREFRESVLEAEARAQIAAMACVTKAIRDGDWKAAAWMLERRVPEQFAPRSRLFDPHRVLEILEEEGLVVDRERALQALAEAEPGVAMPRDVKDDLDSIDVSDEERRLLLKVLRSAHESPPVVDAEPA